LTLAATGLTIAVSATPLGYRLLNASQKDWISGFNPNAWLAVTPDNKVTITVGSSEMGQGTHTAFAMIVADELEADWNQVQVRQGGARKEYINPILHLQITVASAAVRGFYDILRKAGAGGRAMLVEAAAQQWKVPTNECEALNNVVKHKKSGRSLTYGQLCLKAAELQIPQDASLKKESEFRYMGTSLPRLTYRIKPTARLYLVLILQLMTCTMPCWHARRLTEPRRQHMIRRRLKLLKACVKLYLLRMVLSFVPLHSMPPGKGAMLLT
jgi:hypothetical protein